MRSGLPRVGRGKRRLHVRDARALEALGNRGRLSFASFLYEELRASERLGLSREWLEGLLYGNGIRVLARSG
jgi:hypothetical protein